jgi:hypothetical protein
MKKLSLLFVSAIFAYQTNAVAQTVKKTSTKTSTQTTTKSTGTAKASTGAGAKVGTTATPGRTGNAAVQEYSTAPRDGVNTYTDQSNNDHQGATAETTDQTVTILNPDRGDTKTDSTKATTTTTTTTTDKNGPKKLMSPAKKVKP